MCPVICEGILFNLPLLSIRPTVQGYLGSKGLFLSQPIDDIVHLRILSDNLDESEEQSIDGEEVGEDADDVDEDAVADKEVDLPTGLPHVQPIDIFLQ